MLRAYISAGGPGHLVYTHGIMDSIKYQTKNMWPKKVTDSVRNIIMGHVLIFQPYNNQNANLKNNTQMGHWAQNQTYAMTIPVFWLEPCRKWVRWTEEKRHQQGAGNLKGLKWFWMNKWSLISCQVFSNIIRHYRRTFRSVKRKWRFQKYYLYSAFHETIVAKQLYRQLSFYNRFIYCRNLKYFTYGKILLTLYILWGVGIISSQEFGHLR